MIHFRKAIFKYGQGEPSQDETFLFPLQKILASMQNGEEQEILRHEGSCQNREKMFKYGLFSERRFCTYAERRDKILQYKGSCQKLRKKCLPKYGFSYARRLCYKFKF